jgi:endogenous inhibitor of DNA gyrase (YacG/DUF329 family)
MSYCPVCQKSAVDDHSPFCSSLCKNIDLLRWFNEGYSIETSEVPLHESVEGEEEHRCEIILGAKE